MYRGEGDVWSSTININKKATVINLVRYLQLCHFCFVCLRSLSFRVNEHHYYHRGVTVLVIFVAVGDVIVAAAVAAAA